MLNLTLAYSESLQPQLVEFNKALQAVGKVITEHSIINGVMHLRVNAITVTEFVALAALAEKCFDTALLDYYRTERRTRKELVS